MEKGNKKDDQFLSGDANTPEAAMAVGYSAAYLSRPIVITGDRKGTDFSTILGNGRHA